MHKDLKPVLLVRPESAAGGNVRDAAALEALGIPTVVDAFLELHTSKNVAPAFELLEQLPNAQWLVFTSAKAVESLCEIVGQAELHARLANAPKLRVAFIGLTSQVEFLHRFEDVIPQTRQLSAAGMTSESLAAEIIAQTSNEPAGLVLFPQSQIALSIVETALSDAGFTVQPAAVYEVAELAKPQTAASLQAGEFSAVVFRSPSAVKAVRSQVEFITAKIVTTAGATLQAAIDAGFEVAAVSELPTPESVARAVAQAISKDQP